VSLRRSPMRPCHTRGMSGAVASLSAILAVLSAVLGVAALPSQPARDPLQLASELNLAQQTIDNRTSSPADVAAAGRFEQLAVGQLTRGSATARRATLHLLARPTAAALGTDLDAASALAQLHTPRHALPPWRIIAPPPPNTLLGYFKGAQARFGIPWQYLASIELIETTFGRIDGLSVAGAEGPMQFMPATWAAYGRGDARNPRDAIFGAARYLAANGAPMNMADAVYHYNPSRYYVRAVEDYAARMRADPRAYYGYYSWQVIYEYSHRRVILPVGFPKVRPTPLGPRGRSG
jgi:membrane-bound lytic murein transglycosylase B